MEYYDISAENAVEHIYNSLDNTNATEYFDPEDKVTWSIHGIGDSLLLDFTDEDGELIDSAKFRLVRVD